ncbi:MAG TPA: hypothetical protein VJI46_02025 [Candidatus Nanoarchaeia archaeon]|nr:hypothetical protein [Candidatus Nanoarchaeia archaeon]
MGTMSIEQYKAKYFGGKKPTKKRGNKKPPRKKPTNNNPFGNGLFGLPPKRSKSNPFGL